MRIREATRSNRLPDSLRQNSTDSVKKVMIMRSKAMSLLGFAKKSGNLVSGQNDYNMPGRFFRRARETGPLFFSSPHNKKAGARKLLPEGVDISR